MIAAAKDWLKKLWAKVTWRKRYIYGVDLAKGPDKSARVRGYIDRKGNIVIDQIETWED